MGKHTIVQITIVQNVRIIQGSHYRTYIVHHILRTRGTEKHTVPHPKYYTNQAERTLLCLVYEFTNVGFPFIAGILLDASLRVCSRIS